MDKFSFMLHPQTLQDYVCKYPAASHLPEFILNGLARVIPPFKLSDIKGVYSSLAQVEGEIIYCPITTKQMLQMPEKVLLTKIIQAVRLAEKKGAQLVGLGTLMSAIADGGVSAANKAGIPVTTGNSYTVFSALECVKKAAELMEIDLPSAHVLIFGAAGSIGSVCARLLAKESRYFTLVTRQKNHLEKLSAKILYETGLAVKLTGNIKSALRQADIIVAATTALDARLEPEDLKPGAVICDVIQPHAFSLKVAGQRNDVLVIEEGEITVPGNPEFNFDFGFPAGKCSAGMAEVIILALEKRFESFSMGKEVKIEQVLDIGRLAAKHGFRLSGLRSCGKSLTRRDIERIKRRITAKP